MRRIMVIDIDTAPAVVRALVAELLEDPAAAVIAVGNRYRREELLAQFPDLIPANVVVSRSAVYG